MVHGRRAAVEGVLHLGGRNDKDRHHLEFWKIIWQLKISLFCGQFPLLGGGSAEADRKHVDRKGMICSKGPWLKSNKGR